MEQQGIYERIKERVKQLKEESQDRLFTEYLVKLESSLIQEKHQLDLIEAGLERNLRIYQQRMGTAESVSRPQVPGADMPQVQPETENVFGAFSEGTVARQTPSTLYLQCQAPSQYQTVSRPQETPQYQTVPWPQGMPQYQTGRLQHGAPP